MRTENTTDIAGSLDRIVELAADIERWPEILPHYRWVKLLDGGGDRKLVEMAARRGRFPVRWRAIQEIQRDGATLVIAYRHVGGVTKGMDVAWTFEPGADRVRVRIRHDFQPPWPIVGGVVADYVIGPYFVEAIANRTLGTIKEIVEREDGGTAGQRRVAS